MSLLTITNCKGFQITFDNGWTVSVQIGGGNYCDNYKEPVYPPKHPLPPSSTAEIAAWDANGHWYSFGKGNGKNEVNGYVPINDVLKFINKISRKKSHAH